MKNLLCVLVVLFCFCAFSSGYRRDYRLSASKVRGLSTWRLHFSAETPEDQKDKTLYKVKEGSTFPEGYISSDLSSINQGKQVRVLIYIALAILPCLFLIPFFLNRDFIPIDPNSI